MAEPTPADPVAVPAGRAAPGRPGGRWSPFLWLLGIAGATALIAWSPLHGDCGFKLVTGAPCPGCGMTRAAGALAAGDPGEAWRWHPLVFPLAAGYAALLAAALHEGLTGRPTFRRPADRHGVRVAVAGAVLLAAVWAVRVLVRPDWSPDPIRPGSLASRLLR